MTAAQRLRAARFRAGWTQKQLAEAAGVNVSTVRRIEAGETEHLRAETARRLADAIGVDAGALTGHSADALQRLASVVDDSGDELVATLLSMRVAVFVALCQRAGCDPVQALTEVLGWRDD